jgi:hypothetical protein
VHATLLSACLSLLSVQSPAACSSNITAQFACVTLAKLSLALPTNNYETFYYAKVESFKLKRNRERFLIL